MSDMKWSRDSYMSGGGGWGGGGGGGLIHPHRSNQQPVILNFGQPGRLLSIRLGMEKYISVRTIFSVFFSTSEE